MVDGILVFDGVQADKLTPHVEKGGQNLQTVKEYGDVDLVCRLVHRGWSGQRRLSEERAADPDVVQPARFGRAVQQQGRRRGTRSWWPTIPPDRWNTFHIIQRNGDMTTVWLNGQLVVDNVKMENYWDYSKPLPAKGNIELQYHGHKLYWKNIYAKDLK